MIGRLLGLALLFSAPGGQAQDRRDVITRGKAATAFLDLAAQNGSATAVCVDPGGLFVTSQHVVKALPPDASLKLVLHPNDPNRLELQAKVLRRDAASDLAVLRVEGKPEKPFEFLRLGDDSKLFETMSVTAFGYPFGKALAGQNQTYPEISVNVGRITALRKSDGKLDRIQLDAQLNPGNSGGPVIDESGGIVGIVQSGVFATGVNFAVPATRLKDLLEKPELRFQPPTILLSKKHEETGFEIEVVPFLRPLAGAAVELELRVEGREPRKFAAAAAGGNRYLVKAAPLPAPATDEPVRFGVTVTFAQGSLSGMVEDRTVEVGAASLKLSELRSIRWEGTPGAVRRDGTAVEGAIRGLAKIPVDLGGARIEVDLSAARRMDLQAPRREPPRISYVLTVRIEREELARLEGALRVEVPAAGPLPAAAFVPYRGPKKTIELPDTVTDAILGGGGRLMLLHLKKSRKVAVYDVNTARIARYLTMGSENLLLAAGMDQLVVVAPSEGVVERWSLETFERELTRPIPVQGVVKAVAMGYASSGPLLVHWAASTDSLARASYAFFDTEKFERIAVQEFRGHNSSYRDAVHLRASGTGDVFGLWATSHSPQGMETFVLTGDQVKVSYQHDSAGHVVPGYDGRAICTGIAGICTPELVRKGERNARQMPTVPSIHPRFYLAVPLEPGAQVNLGSAPYEGQKPALYALGSESRLVDLPPFEMGRSSDNASWSAGDFTIDKRVLFVPQAHQVVSVPFTNDRIVVQPFDLRGAMDQAKIDYFYVTSVPGRTFRKGETWRYAVEVASKAGGVEFELSSGPPGMTIGKAGELEWAVPDDFRENRVNVIVSVKNAAGQSMYESFEIRPR